MTRSRRNPLQRMNYVLLLALSGCGTQQSTPASPCAWGSEVKIPEVDSTRPAKELAETILTKLTGNEKPPSSSMSERIQN